MQQEAPSLNRARKDEMLAIINSKSNTTSAMQIFFLDTSAMRVLLDESAKLYNSPNLFICTDSAAHEFLALTGGTVSKVCKRLLQRRVSLHIITCRLFLVLLQSIPPTSRMSAWSLCIHLISLWCLILPALTSNRWESFYEMGLASQPMKDPPYADYPASIDDFTFARLQSSDRVDFKIFVQVWVFRLANILGGGMGPYLRKAWIALFGQHKINR